jgi:hypothetical protein
MDRDEELARFKFLLGAAVVFLISGYFAYGELKFALLGKTAEATVIRTFNTKEMRSRGRSRELLVVEYQFIEANGTARSERDDVPAGWPLPTTGKVLVQYLPGMADSSRLEGHRSLVSVFVFLAALAGLTFFIVKLWREASAAVSETRGKKKR